MTPLARVGLVIVNYGSSGLLVNAPLPAVGTVVIVDNFSTALEREAISALCEGRGWHLVAHDTNRGFGAGVNAGVAAAIGRGAEALVVLNPDATVSTEAVQQLLAELDAEPASLIAPTVYTEQGTVWFAGGVLDRRHGIARHAATAATEPDWVTGACMCFHAAMWAQVDGFDERYFLYWEDVDFSARWRNAGGQLRISVSAVAVHSVGGTQALGALQKSATYIRYNLRGRRLYAALHCSTRERLRWCARTPMYLRRLARITGLRQRPLSLREFWIPAIRGVTERLPRA
ncbi:MAG TPA: glycosyltransferase family 2 protein [Candidatus Lumbricidophila sp.]|nr:glycosyltransferase family 2 protein [Candidatus Lumbricidophila sp.]